MMKKKLPVWLLWPFAVFLLGIWHLLDVRASVTETGHHWLYGWYGGLFFVSMVILIGFGVLIFGKNWEFFGGVFSESVGFKERTCLTERIWFKDRMLETSRSVLWSGHVPWYFVYAGPGASFSTG